jgi:hypothetical protein
MQNSFRFSQWNHLFYFLLQGIILILKCSRYFICSESIKKMSIFAWYLVLFSVFLLYTSIESTCICKSFHFFLLRSESNLHFPHLAFGRSGCRCYNWSFWGGKWVYTDLSGGKTSIYSFFRGNKWVCNTGIRSFQKLDGENEDLTLILREKNGNQYILIFPPRKISIYSSFPLIFRREIWVYTEVSPSYSILPLCTDRLCKGNNSRAWWY